MKTKMFFHLFGHLALDTAGLLDTCIHPLRMHRVCFRDGRFGGRVAMCVYVCVFLMQNVFRNRNEMELEKKEENLQLV